MPLRRCSRRSEASRNSFGTPTSSLKCNGADSGLLPVPRTSAQLVSPRFGSVRARPSSILVSTPTRVVAANVVANRTSVETADDLRCLPYTPSLFSRPHCATGHPEQLGTPSARRLKRNEEESRPEERRSERDLCNVSGDRQNRTDPRPTARRVSERSYCGSSTTGLQSPRLFFLFFAPTKALDAPIPCATSRARPVDLVPIAHATSTPRVVCLFDHMRRRLICRCQCVPRSDATHLWATQTPRSRWPKTSLIQAKDGILWRPPMNAHMRRCTDRRGLVTPPSSFMSTTATIRFSYTSPDIYGSATYAPAIPPTQNYARRAMWPGYSPRTPPASNRSLYARKSPADCRTL